ncbi:helix-turn-helix domain-containing protein [Nakamurella leprariae]|uniref:Helix-turn-helix transcriptional regulator n=1 Tax=Nakamurella leprariae TaxID=2803911 RepID=A0A938YJB9_9ACTN|nr:AraC family transcriptional regulator [Nakamurella leprariae]MBM9468918.1 helix-turn-helix transcriptional regulator [Nakamurella leprariae]
MHPASVLSESVPWPVHPALRPFVAAITGYRQEGLPPGQHRGLPSPYLTLILTVDEPLHLAAHADPGQPPARWDAMVGGLHARPALIRHEGRQWGAQVALTPWGSRALLGCPAGALVCWDADLADLFGGGAAALVEDFRAASGWASRLAVVQTALLARLAAGDHRWTVPAELREAWRLIHADAGRVRIDAVARAVGWSPRRLTARMRAETGLPPKTVARVARFDRARRRLGGRVAAGRDWDLATLAAECGYADQAHLTREWRSLSGLPPTGWVAAESGMLVETGAAAEADADGHRADHRFVQDRARPQVARSVS